jgi:hypothetical protein
LIYSHKPQRSGRSIQANTNNPPQDPPPPSEIILPETVVPDILIADSTPPVPEPCIHEASVLPEKKVKKTPKKVTPKPENKVITKPVKITWRTRIVSFFKKLFRRSA